MTRVSRVVATVLCAGLAAAVVGISGELRGDPDLNRASGIAEQASDILPTGRDNRIEAASSLPEVGEQKDRMAAAQHLLSARAAAVKARSKSAWMATVDPAGAVFRERQSVAFDNLMKLPIGQFSYGTVQLAATLPVARAQRAGPKAWAASITGAYRLAGFDRAPRSFVVTYTMVRRPGGWRIADDIDGITALQMWDLPGMRVVRGQSGIVIGNAPKSRMRDYSRIADSAIRRVRGVWGTDWNAHVVLVTPSTAREFARLLMYSADKGKGLDQVAAITQGAIAKGQRAHGDRVVINPKAFTALQPLGRRVVITHEMAHVAARSSTTSPVPIWLAEGVADYVGYSGLNFPRQHVARELLTRVRTGKVPKALPAEVDFDPSRTSIAPSYSAAWLAVSRLVDLYGQAKVVAFYRVVAAGPTHERTVQRDPKVTAALVFPKYFGVTQARFVDGWRRYLRTLARATR